MWILDSNVWVAFAQREAECHNRVLGHGDDVGWDNVGVPIVVAAELLDGRLKYLAAAHRRSSRQLVVAFRLFEETYTRLNLFTLVPFDDAALAVYTRSQFFPETMSRGDRLIASIAIAGSHRLVTRNVAHFAGTPGLALENWIDEALP